MPPLAKVGFNRSQYHIALCLYCTSLWCLACYLLSSLFGVKCF